jgi:hypothetical protein
MMLVIVDETHERTLRTDIVLASLKCILASNAMRWGRSGSSYAARLDSAHGLTLETPM